MANVDDLNGSRSKKTVVDRSFRYLDPNGSLEEQGFYLGFPCHLGHRIRDSKQHWCYHCALRIQSNVCGLDLNFINRDYQNILTRVMKNVAMDNPDAPHEGCWHVRKGFKAPSYPSWRSHSTGRLADRVQIKKIIYQAFWGDVGRMYVTTAANLCGDETCVNPLHTTSSFNSSANRRPVSFQYLDLDWNPQKHAIMALRQSKGQTIDYLLKQLYRPTIRDPKIESNKQSRQDIDDEPERISKGTITI